MKEYRKNNPQVTKRVSVTLSAEEYNLLKKQAESHNITPTKQLKKLAFSQLKNQENYPQEVRKSLHEFVHILRGVSNNINQLAHHSNTFETIVDQNKVFQQLFQLENEVKQFLSEK
jgi:glutathionyl-hydroquinone reductase